MFKTCKGCVEIKPLDEFSKHKKGRNGHTSRCKKCMAADARRYRQTEKGAKKAREYRKKNRERQAETKRAWIKRTGYKPKPQGKRDSRQYLYARQQWYREHPNAMRAHGAVSQAVQKGALPRVSSLACQQCGNQARHYHHHLGYDQEHWLHVIPLCQSCHISIHKQSE